MNEDVGQLHQRIAGLARKLHNLPGNDSQAVIDELVIAAVQIIPGAQYSGLTVASRQREISTPASTHWYGPLLDKIQQQTLQGPCLTAARNHRTVHVNDLSSDERWSDFRRAALEETPIRSILSFELFTSRQSLGALSVYADCANAFDDHSIEIGLIFATHAALAWDSVRRECSFQCALASRDLIGQAKGMLMQQLDIDAERAFELLKQLSQSSNTVLVDIARRIIELQGRPFDV